MGETGGTVNESQKNIASLGEHKIGVNVDNRQNFDFDYPSEYRDRVRITFKELQGILQQNEDSIILGPTYHINSSVGEPLVIDSFSVGFKDKYQITHRRYYIVAQDANGNIVGDRTTDIRELEFKEDRYARAAGMIATGKRGGRISSTIESAHMDLLQREANRLGERIDWHISNYNLEVLKELREEFRLNPSEELKTKVDNMEAEQKRWQEIYGINGKLGFDNTGTKSFAYGDSEEKYSPPGSIIDKPPTDVEENKQLRVKVLDRVLTGMKKILTVIED